MFTRSLLIASLVFLSVPVDAQDLLVAGLMSNNVLRYDSGTGQFRGVFASGPEMAGPTGIAFGPDRNLYVAMINSGEILRYDGTTGAFLGRFVSDDPATPNDETGGSTGNRSLKFGPDGHLYVAAGSLNQVLRFHGRTGKLIDVVAQGQGMQGVTSVAFGPDGNLYVAAALSNAIYVFRGTSGEFLRQFSCGEGNRNLTGIEFAPDGVLFATASDRNAIFRYNAGTGECLGSVISGGALRIPIAILFNTAGNLLVTSLGSDSVLEYTRAGQLSRTVVSAGSGGLSGPHSLAFMPGALPQLQARLSVPAQARTAGSGGSFFRSSVWISNQSSASLPVRLRYVPGVGFPATPTATSLTTIAPGQLVIYEDVLTEAFGASANTVGVVLVEVPDGVALPVVTSRTFNDAPGGTFGQYIAAVSLTAGMTAGTIHGLQIDTASRTNIGVVNLGPAALSANLVLRDSSGGRQGSDVPVQVPAFSMIQVGSINALAGVPALTSFGVEAALAPDSAPGSSFFLYASKLDQITSDPIFAIPLREASLQWIDGIAAAGGEGGTFFRSTLSLAAPQAAPAVIEASFTPRNGTAPTLSAVVSLAAGESKFYQDVIAELFNSSNTVGWIRLTGGGSFSAWARTYNDRGTSGTHGQFIPAFTAAELIDTRAILQGLSEDAGFRTNLGLINVSPAAVSVDVSVHAATGAQVGSKRYELLPNQAISEGRVLAAIGATDRTDTYLMIRPSSPDAVYAWASFVDNRSTDQTFVRPVPLP